MLDTTTAAGFSIVGIYTQERDEQGITRVTEVFSWEVPYVLSILAFNHPMAGGAGHQRPDRAVPHRRPPCRRRVACNQLQEEFASELATLSVGPVPNVMVSYWSFRLMMGLGFVSMGISLLILWFTRKGRTPSNKIWQYLMGSLPFFPLFANSFGWILTEMGRQPWIVYGVLPTWTANSPNVSFEAVLTSMIAYTLIYGIIAVIVLNLFFTFIGKGLPDVTPPKVRTDDDSPLAFAY